MAAVSTFCKLSEERVTVKTVQYGRNDPALTNAIREGEHARVGVVPLDIGILPHIDEQEESHKDQREASLNKFLEQDTVFHKVKSLGHIHAAGEDIGTIPHEVADSLDHTPTTHRCGATRLVSKL